MRQARLPRWWPNAETSTGGGDSLEYAGSGQEARSGHGASHLESPSLKPHRGRGLQVQLDPQAEDKIFDVVGLYLNRPTNRGRENSDFGGPAGPPDPEDGLFRPPHGNLGQTPRGPSRPGSMKVGWRTGGGPLHPLRPRSKINGRTIVAGLFMPGELDCGLHQWLSAAAAWLKKLIEPFAPHNPSCGLSARKRDLLSGTVVVPGKPTLARCRSLSRALFCRSILPPSHAPLRILQKAPFSFGFSSCPFVVLRAPSWISFVLRAPSWIESRHW